MKDKHSADIYPVSESENEECENPQVFDTNILPMGVSAMEALEESIQFICKTYGLTGYAVTAVDENGGLYSTARFTDDCSEDHKQLMLDGHTAGLKNRTDK